MSSMLDGLLCPRVGGAIAQDKSAANNTNFLNIAGSRLE
jgi:hypothetical protein